MGRGAALLALLALAGAPPARAALEFNTLSADPGSGVEIEVRGYYDRLPRSGHAPVEVAIRNGTARARTWQMTFRSRATGGGRVLEEEITVEPGARRTVEVLVPLDASPSAASIIVEVEMEGPGISGVASGMQHSTSNGPDVPFLALSERLAPWAAGAAKGLLEGAKRAQSHAVFDATLMPQDWRGLAGFDVMWITDTELALLAPAARAAVVDWVLHGGRLVVHGLEGSGTSWSALASVLPEGAADAGAPPCGPAGCEIAVGMGEVVTRSWDGSTLDPSLPSELVGGRRVLDALAPDPAVASWVDPIEVHGGLLLGFVVCFALTVGPLNLRWLARAPNRWRLFVTTPLISLVASALLVLLILLQDGIGGSGHRTALSLLVPSLSREILVQEQAARTGVLLGRSFAAEPTALLAPLPEDASPGVASWARRSYVLAGGRHAGDWFANRSVQSHLVLAARATRARVEWLNAGEDAPPRVLSTIELPLEQLSFRDPAGRLWVGASVRPGVPVTLRRADERAFHGPVAGAGGGGRNVAQRLERVLDRTGFFFARVERGGSQAVATLPSIRWNDVALYAGPVVPAGRT